LAYNPSVMADGDIDVYSSHISGPGGLKGALDHFRAFPIDALQNKESATHKITMPVFVLGGEFYPALGGHLPGNFALESIQALATNVKGVIVPLSGYWIPEEQPQFVIKQLAIFFTEK
jgi:pimeloyl-ACP methyl ester carboxylesterase